MCEDEKLTGFVKDVADAIREVEGSSDQIKPVDFPERIKNLSSSSGFIYNVDTVDETSVPTADLEKLKSDPNAMIIETYNIAPVNFKIYYRKMFKSGDTYDRFVSVYSTANEERINQTTLRAYRDLNYTTSTLSKKRTVNIVNEDQLAGYLRRPADNPTKDSLVAVSSNGGISWQPIDDFLKKNTTASAYDQVYYKNTNGSNIMRNVRSVPDSYVIPIYNGKGQLKTNDPEVELDCVNKQYLEANYNGKPADNPTEDSFVKVSSTGSTSWQPVSDFLARPTSAANSDRVCIIPDGQTKFGYRNAYKTVYNVENVMVIRDIRGTVPQPDPQREQDGVNLRYLQANYNANPTLDGTETELTGVTIGGTKYKVPSGGGSGDVTAAGDNTFTGSNIFKKAITLYTDTANDTYVSAILDSYKLELHHDLANTQANLNITDETAPYLELKTAGHGKVKYTQESIIYTDTIGNQKTTTLKLPGQGATTDSTQIIATLDDCFTYIDKTINNVISTSTTTTFTADEMTQIYNNYSTTVIHLSSLESGASKPVEKFLYPYGKAQDTNFFMFVSPVYSGFEYVLTVSGNAGAAATATITRVSVGAKPSGNPTQDSVVKISSTGTTSYLGIDTTATSASTNLITSGAVAAVKYSLSQSIAGCASEPDISTFPENDDAFFIGEKTSHASKWLPKKQMTLKSHKIHFDAFDSDSSVGQYDDAFISVLCYTETPFTVETLTIFMLATGQSYPVCSPSGGMVGYVMVSNTGGEISWEDKGGNRIALSTIRSDDYTVTDIQSFFPFE